MATISLNYSTEAIINESPYQEGAIYVATDTKKTYVDLNGERMCLSPQSAGSKEIVYSNTQPQDETPLWIQPIE